MHQILCCYNIPLVTIWSVTKCQQLFCEPFCIFSTRFTFCEGQHFYVFLFNYILWRSGIFTVTKNSVPMHNGMKSVILKKMNFNFVSNGHCWGFVVTMLTMWESCQWPQFGLCLNACGHDSLENEGKFLLCLACGRRSRAYRHDARPFVCLLFQQRVSCITELLYRRWHSLPWVWPAPAKKSTSMGTSLMTWRQQTVDCVLLIGYCGFGWLFGGGVSGIITYGQVMGNECRPDLWGERIPLFNV